jgi:sortase (surface protein transpeptidase)
VIRSGAVLLLIFAACSTDPGSGVTGRAVSAITTVTVAVTAGPPADPEPQSQNLIRTTTSTVHWASVRIEDDKPAETSIPVRIEIAAIALEAPILPLGVAAETGQMEVPENVDEVGWYRYGPAPGWPGSAVLAAHVDMAGEGPGAFFHLDRLRTGDRISVAFEEGTTSNFAVLLAEQVPKGELNFDSVFSSAGQPLLRLVTCGGAFNRSTRTYDDNLVITAHPLRP